MRQLHRCISQNLVGLTVWYETAMWFDSHLNVVVPLDWNDFEVSGADWYGKVVSPWSITVKIPQKHLLLSFFNNWVPVDSVWRVLNFKASYPTIWSSFSYHTCQNTTKVSYKTLVNLGNKYQSDFLVLKSQIPQTQ